MIQKLTKHIWYRKIDFKNTLLKKLIKNILRKKNYSIIFSIL